MTDPNDYFNANRNSKRESHHEAPHVHAEFRMNLVFDIEK